MSDWQPIETLKPFTFVMLKLDNGTEAIGQFEVPPGPEVDPEGVLEGTEGWCYAGHVVAREVGIDNMMDALDGEPTHWRPLTPEEEALH